MKNQYLATSQTAYLDVLTAIEQATLLLPSAVRSLHYAATRGQSLTPWDSARHAYYGQGDADPHISRVLTDLVLLSQIKALLKTIVLPEPETEPDLSLATVRRRF